MSSRECERALAARGTSPKKCACDAVPLAQTPHAPSSRAGRSNTHYRTHNNCARRRQLPTSSASGRARAHPRTSTHNIMHGARGPQPCASDAGRSCSVYNSHEQKRRSAPTPSARCENPRWYASTIYLKHVPTCAFSHSSPGKLLPSVLVHPRCTLPIHTPQRHLHHDAAHSPHCSKWRLATRRQHHRCQQVARLACVHIGPPVRHNTLYVFLHEHAPNDRHTIDQRLPGARVNRPCCSNLRSSGRCHWHGHSPPYQP